MQSVVILVTVKSELMWHVNEGNFVIHFGKINSTTVGSETGFGLQ